MASLQLPHSFEQSYENFESYPCNLIHKTQYPGELNSYKQRLDDTASKLCKQNEKDVAVPFRDFSISQNIRTRQGNYLHYYLMIPVLISSAVEKRNVFNDSGLKSWLGDTSALDPLASRRTGALATKPDPRCRFMFVHLERKSLLPIC